MMNRQLPKLEQPTETLLDSLRAGAEPLKAFVNQAAIDDGTGPVEILFDGVVGDWWAELDSASIGGLLMKNRGRDVLLRLNSPGGIAFDGIAIYSALLVHDATVTARVEGLAASAASIIAMAADRIQMFDNTNMHVHYTMGGVFGHAHDFEDVLTWIRRLDSSLARTYAARTGQSLERVHEWLEGVGHDGTMFSADEALQFGLTDEVLPLKKRPAKPGARSNRKSGAQRPAATGNRELDAQRFRVDARMRSRKRRKPAELPSLTASSKPAAVKPKARDCFDLLSN